jgi:hypothetical protein
VPDGDEEPGARLSRLLGSWATVIAPASILSALLFYFGYVSSRSQYEYFGIDVDTVGLDTQDYVMRSPQPLLVPLLVLTLLSAGLLALHAAVRRRVEAAATATAGGARPAGDVPHDGSASSGRAADPAASIERAARLAMIAGLAVLGTGVALLFGYSLLRGWPFYSLVTPLLLAVGAGLVAYAPHVSGLQRVRHPAPIRTDESTDTSLLLRRTARVLIYVLIAASVFWATATVAQWSGRGLAQDQALNLDRLPRVILDTKERLYLRTPVVEESILPPSQGQTFRYRYRRLRLLIVGQDRLFLVPEQWSASNSTLVVPLDGSNRVQFQFQNQQP